MKQMHSQRYTTAAGLEVFRASMGVDGAAAREELLDSLDHTQGVLLSSACEFPGRYTRWDLGVSAPPLRISARDRQVTLQALNARGEVLLRFISSRLARHDDFRMTETHARRCLVEVRASDPVRYEEDRTRQRSVFTVLRAVVALFASEQDAFLGLYGAFGYDLVFQFETLVRRLPRPDDQRDLVLYLPDSILVIDHKRERAQQHVYDFAFEDAGRRFSTVGLSRAIPTDPYVAASPDGGITCDHGPGEYAAVVRDALGAFRRGDLFEVVPGQTFATACPDTPATVFRRLQHANPAPYGALMNLGEQEYLVAASPEMFVRVDEGKVETCPISGTIARGADALEDAEQVRRLLNSTKDEAELSMCTDVDRNDKSRVCVPGSVRVRGRRLVEFYSRLIHTADHIEGELKPGMDALDAFLSHAWAVTVTGAPKPAALQFIEDHEREPRRWYGGAMGCLHFSGQLNTGLTLRTIRVAQGRATVRAGATLLADSDPEAEEAETRLKASALLAALRPQTMAEPARSAVDEAADGADLRVLLVDHRDSFVHTLASYLAHTGALTRTVRPAAVEAALADFVPDLVVLSPGPGRPDDSGMRGTIDAVLARGCALFGVCLGLQGIVEYFGGRLAQLPEPVHGKASTLSVAQGPLFAGLARPLVVGRYHSLVAAQVPDCLHVCAHTDDGAVMAVAHRVLPVSAVQFHPESILSATGGSGMALLRNLVRTLREREAPGSMGNGAGRQVVV